MESENFQVFLVLTGSFILVLKLTFSPDPFPRNLPLSL